jgi:multidrug efflux system outer membrane protein
MHLSPDWLTMRTLYFPSISMMLLLQLTASPALAQQGQGQAAQSVAADAPIEIPALPADPARSVNLESALASASASAADPVIAALQVERARAAQRTALAGVIPFVNGIGNVNQYDSEVERSGVLVRPAQAFDVNLQIGVTLSGRAFNALATTAAQTDVSHLQAVDSQRLARANAAKAFFSVLTARRNAEILRSQYAAAMRQDTAVMVRVEVGTAVPLDRARSQLAVLDLARRIVDADASLSRSWDLLGQAMGLEEPINANEVAQPEEHESLEHYLSRALAERPDLRALRSATEVAEHGVDDAWWRFGPTLSLSWTATYRGPTTFVNPDASNWFALGTLSIPIFDGGARYGALRDARAAVEQARVREAALRRMIRVDVRDAFRRMDSASQAIELALRSSEVARANATRAEAAYSAGATNGIELDDARRNLEQSQITLLLRRLDRQLALIDLLAAAGQL